MPEQLNLQDLPEDVGKVKKYPWAYILLVVCNVLTFVVTDSLKEKDNKPCNDMNIYLLKKIDSSSRDQILYMRHATDLEEQVKKLKLEKDSNARAVHTQVNPLADKVIQQHKNGRKN